MPQLVIRVLGEALPVAVDDELDTSDVIYELQADWLIRENNGDIRAQGQTNYAGLGELIDPGTDWLEDPGNVVVIIPSEQVLMINCEVPGRNVGQIRKALPFAAEEYVASDIELMHIAHGPIKSGQPVLCHIVPHESMENWLDCFNSLGLSPGYFVTDAQLLPHSEDSAGLLFDENNILVATDTQAAQLDDSTLSFVLSGLDVQTLYCVNGELSELAQGQLDPQPNIVLEALPDGGVVHYFAQQFRNQVHSSNLINLLQGQYQAKKAANPNVTKWRSVMAVAAVWVLIAFVGMIVQGYWASSEADRLQAEAFDFYNELYQGESKPVSVQQLKRRVMNKLGQSTSGSTGNDFVGLLANFANVAEPTNIVSSINYQRQELSLEVLLESYDDIDPLKDKLAGLGIVVDVNNAQQQTNGVQSRLRMRFSG